MLEVDNEIILLAQRGDREAFERLYNHYSSYVWKVVFRTVNGDMDAATHITQNVFVRVHGKLARFNGNSGFSTWLFRITYTTAMSYLKSRNSWWQRLRPLQDTVTEPGHDGIFANKDLARDVLKSLAPSDRFLLVAREVHGFSFEELESVTEKNAGALRTQLHRIKQSLRKEFGDEYK